MPKLRHRYLAACSKVTKLVSGEGRWKPRYSNVIYLFFCVCMHTHFFLVEVQLIYNISGMWQSDWHMHYFSCSKNLIFILSILFQILFPFRLLQNIEQSSLCYIIGPCWLSILNIILCTHQSKTSSLSPTLFPPGNHRFVKSVFLFCK